MILFLTPILLVYQHSFLAFNLIKLAVGSGEQVAPLVHGMIRMTLGQLTGLFQVALVKGEVEPKVIVLQFLGQLIGGYAQVEG